MPTMVEGTLPAPDGRGSNQLISTLVNKGLAATPADVKAALAIPANADYTLLRWNPRGIPPVYYEVEAAFQVPRTELATALSNFTGLDGLKQVKILTHGIPPVYDAAEIEVVVGGN
jgi:hypothetical protein